jgi:nucleoside-diphosphate-sugar epimerase
MPERLLIFGATGGTGMQLVHQALERGYHVTAFVRDPTKLDIEDDKLEFFIGNFLDADAVDQAMSAGFDAVLSPIGIYQREYKTTLSDGTKNILAAMKKHGIARLLVVSSMGAGDSKGQGSWLVRAYSRFMLKYVIWDKDTQETDIRASGLDWTIVRPPRLLHTPDINPDVIVWSGPQPKRKFAWNTSRPTLAKVVLDALSKGQYIGQAVNISDPSKAR